MGLRKSKKSIVFFLVLFIQQNHNITPFQKAVFYILCPSPLSPAFAEAASRRQAARGEGFVVSSAERIG
jgi:hypothetical protein